MSVFGVILAAGKGTRMKSELPKPLHRLLGVPVIDLLLDVMGAAVATPPLVVVGHQRQALEAHLEGRARFAVQRTLSGTGDAIKTALSELPEDGTMLLVYADVPLLQAATLKELLTIHEREQALATLLVARVGDPTGYGRIITDEDGRFLRIVEQADATAAEAAVDRVNVGAFAFSIASLRRHIGSLTRDNAQGEFYLTDVFAAMAREGRVALCETGDADEAIAFNDRAGLCRAEAALRHRVLRELQTLGVTVEDLDAVSVDPRARVGPDVVLCRGTVIEGRTSVGAHSVLGPDCRIVDSRLGEGVAVSYSVVEWSQIGSGATIGPFSRIGAGSVVHEGASVVGACLHRVPAGTDQTPQRGK